jgi:hypothetical protein
MFQVKELEGGVSTHSPFIVVDHFALIRNLNVVRRIVEAKKFAVVIPSAGRKGKDTREIANLQIVNLSIKYLVKDLKNSPFGFFLQQFINYKSPQFNHIF